MYPDHPAPAVPLNTPTTRVVHVNDRIPDAVYIGRAMPRRGLKGSPFANPFKIGAPSFQQNGLATRDMMSRRDVIERYKLWIMAPAQRHLLALLPDLRNRPIACWCRHDGEQRSGANACHADILQGLLDTYTDDELRAMAVQP